MSNSNVGYILELSLIRLNAWLADVWQWFEVNVTKTLSVTVASEVFSEMMEMI